MHILSFRALFPVFERFEQVCVVSLVCTVLLVLDVCFGLPLLLSPFRLFLRCFALITTRTVVPILRAYVHSAGHTLTHGV